MRAMPVLIVGAMITALISGWSYAASGPSGSLTFQGCLRDPTSGSACATVGTGLTQGSGAAITPNGEFFYTSAWASSGKVNIFRRNAGGGLTQIDSVGGTTLSSASGVAVSPEGNTLYVAAHASSALTVFRINGNGTLLQIQCFSEGVISGCTQVTSLDSAFGVAVSPDGRNVYVASYSDLMTNGTVSVFQRQTDGILTFGSCYRNTGAAGTPGCAETAGMVGASKLTVSPDGQNVYLGATAAAQVAGTLVAFARNADGSLLPIGCFREIGSSTPAICTPTAGLNGANGVAVSGDGAQVYLAAYRSGSLVTFARGAGGVLTPVGCFRAADVPGDADCVPIDGLGGVSSVAVSEDGRNVYATGEGSVIGVLLRDVDGQLTPSTCLRDVARTNNPTCTQVIGLDGPETIVLSPDGTSAYVPTFFKGEVTSFVRQAPPACDDASISAPGGVPVSVPTACSDANGDAVTVSLADAPAHGVVSGPDAAGTFTYIPALGYGGADAFTFRGNDGSVDSVPATVSIEVSASTPAVSDFTASPAKFRPGKAAAAAARRTRGTTFAFTLSEDATASIAIASMQKGRLDGGTCVKASAKLRKAPRCTRLVLVGTLTQPSTAGANTLPFSGRIDGKPLRAGRYDATLTATNPAGRASEPRSASLKVTK